jgi:pimeloyl-ACP methyl ester carboxylesterase
MSFIDKHIVSSTNSGEHKIAYQDWGNANDQPIICIHGLTGNSRDFDFLAEDLVKQGYRLISITLPGRGHSDFLEDPLDYNYAQYIKDIFAVLEHENLNAPSCVDWLGISLGGLLGIHIAGLDNTPIRRLIINDVGPVVPQNVLDFIHKVIAEPYYFDSVDALEQRMRATRGLTWGPVTDEQWAHMAEHNHRILDDGRITYAYDPRIAVVFEKSPIGDADLTEQWDKITCPVFVIRGKKSLLLTKKIVKMMQKRIKSGGPEFDLVVLKGCGHAPSLMAPDQIQMIATWLEEVKHDA